MVYGLTVFVSAFLLFQVQFIIGKHLLPWFGGAPSVWSACQVFFQGMLLAGYAYAHGLTRLARTRNQARIHTALLSVAFLCLAGSALVTGTPLLPGPGFKPTPDGDPMLQLIGALGASVALPFLVLSANAPLVQNWHARSGLPLDRTYRLYALSNAGSLLGLVSYPFGFEIVFDLRIQAWIWTGLFLVFAIGCARTAWGAAAPSSIRPASGPGQVADAQPGADEDPRTWRRAPGIATILLWALLPFAASLMLVSTTNQLCQDVAVVPFLWMLPLALYLLTFIISFDRPHWYSRGLITPAALVTVGAISASNYSAHLSVAVQLGVFGLFIFLFCFVCHGELARLRPGRAHLTLYYLVIATGGALGAAAVSFLAPAVFSDFWEFYIGAALGWIIFGIAWARDRSSPFFRGAPMQYAVVIGLMLFMVLSVALWRTSLGRHVDDETLVWWFAGLMAVNLAVVIGLVTWHRATASWGGWSRMFVAATCAGLAFAVYLAWHDSIDRQIVVGRNFYGVVRLRVYAESEETVRVQLTHGTINHGVQLRDEALKMTPTTYYAPRSGVGRALAALRERRDGAPMHVGVLGLGTGTLAAYARAGDRVRFYEINPLVIMLSQSTPAIFTFLRDSAGAVTVEPGDARLTLESELRRGDAQSFDLLAIDVFSSDAIPVHLMTLEAFETYCAHLDKPDAILAVHTSNRFLNLEPVVNAFARRLGLSGVIVRDGGHDLAASASTWVLLSRDAGLIGDIRLESGDDAFPLGEREVLFTDRYSNLLRILDQ